jgi:outer membrane protein assembly factor BamD
MKFKIQCIMISAILCCSYGCAHQSAKLQKSVIPPDKALFETGDNYFKRGQYKKARQSFRELINTYPDSELAPDTVFKLADSDYEEGGADNLRLAEDEYKNFMIFYPKSDKAPEAQLKIIWLNERRIKASHRNQESAYKTLKEIERFERLFPESDYLPLVKKVKIRVQEILARGHYRI